MVTFLILIFLILIHELGHFFAAKKFGVRVDEFGIGLPPKATVLAKKGDTEYTLNWLPLGGFVRLFGEDGDLNLYEKLNPFVKKQSFIGKPAWQRAMILVAGVVMNLLVGLLLFSFIYSVSGVPQMMGSRAVVAKVVKGSPADLAGFEESEALLSVNGVDVTSSQEFVDAVKDLKGQAVTFRLATLLPDGTLPDESMVVTAIPRENPPEGEGALGVEIVTVPILQYDKKPWYTAPFYGIIEGSKEAYAWGREILYGIPKLFGSLIKGKLPEGTTGPVGVVRQGNKIYDRGGIMGALRFGAILSINLAVFNLLPFPGLDGGRLLFLGLEKIIGRKRVSKYENYIHFGGILLLVLLMLIVTWKDIWG